MKITETVKEVVSAVAKDWFKQPRCAAGHLCPRPRKTVNPSIKYKWQCGACGFQVHGKDCGDGDYCSKMSYGAFVHCKLCEVQRFQIELPPKDYRCSRKACMNNSKDLPKVECRYACTDKKSKEKILLHGCCYSCLVIKRHNSAHPDPVQRPLPPHQWMDVCCSKKCHDHYLRKMICFNDPNTVLN